MAERKLSLSNLRPAKGSTKARKRIARGVGSGHGGHSSGKGDKGYKSRSGASIPAWFEGGQMPLQRRVPKGGFKNPFRKEYTAVNLSSLVDLAEQGRIDKSAPVTPTVIVEAGIAGSRDRIKILGNGDINIPLNISAHACSKPARAKVEAAGGSVDIIS